MNILLNNQRIEFTDNDFPMLISGTEKRGVSFFSVCLMANLLNSGQKILFFSAYPSAKEELRKQINKNEDKAIIVDSGEEQDFINIIKNTPDLNERIVLVKNFDIYSQELFKIVKELKSVIFAGDLDNCQFSDELISKDFTTKIFFSQSEKYPQEGLDDLPRYQGRMFSQKKEGLIRLDIK